MQGTYTKSSVPDELGDNTKGTRNTEEDGVVVLLVKAVAIMSARCTHTQVAFEISSLGKKDTRVGIDIGPRVCSCQLLDSRIDAKETTAQLTLGLAGFKKNVGHNLVDLADELEEGVVREVLERKLSLSGVSGVLTVSAYMPSLQLRERFSRQLTVFRRTA